MSKQRYKIYNPEDRRAILTALADAGYAVKVIDGVCPFSHYSERDNWVEVETSDEATDTKECTWTEDENSVWSPSCEDRSWEFTYNGPDINDFEYCPFCGQSIKVIWYAGEQDD